MFGTRPSASGELTDKRVHEAPMCAPRSRARDHRVRAICPGSRITPLPCRDANTAAAGHVSCISGSRGEIARARLCGPIAIGIIGAARCGTSFARGDPLPPTAATGCARTLRGSGRLATLTASLPLRLQSPRGATYGRYRRCPSTRSGASRSAPPPRCVSTSARESQLPHPRMSCGRPRSR